MRRQIGLLATTARGPSDNVVGDRSRPPPLEGQNGFSFGFPGAGGGGSGAKFRPCVRVRRWLGGGYCRDSSTFSGVPCIYKCVCVCVCDILAASVSALYWRCRALVKRNLRFRRSFFFFWDGSLLSEYFRRHPVARRFPLSSFPGRCLTTQRRVHLSRNSVRVGVSLFTRNLTTTNHVRGKLIPSRTTAVGSAWQRRQEERVLSLRPATAAAAETTQHRHGGGGSMQSDKGSSAQVRNATEHVPGCWR